MMIAVQNLVHTTVTGHLLHVQVISAETGRGLWDVVASDSDGENRSIIACGVADTAALAETTAREVCEAFDRDSAKALETIKSLGDIYYDQDSIARIAQALEDAFS